MDMAHWPEWMPNPLQDGYTMQPEDRRIASSTVGTSFSPGFGGDVCIAECNVMLSPLQAKWLEQWERDELVHGSRWFSFPVWYAGQVHWEDCRFKTRPKASSINGFHGTYQFTLYVKRRTELMPDCMVKLFSCWPPCFFPEIEDDIDAIYEEFPIFFSHVSNVTRPSVEDALSEILEN